MKKILALVGARNKEFYRDQSAMCWTFLFPLIVLLGFTYGYSGKQDPVLRVEVSPESLVKEEWVEKFKNIPGIQLHGVSDADAGIKRVQRYQTDLLIQAEAGSPSIGYYLNTESDKGKLAERVFLSVSNEGHSDLHFERRMSNGRRIPYGEWVLPGLLAMNLMFGSMFGVGYVIVRYRKNGVLKRLRATPLSAFQFLTAQVISRIFLMVSTSYLVLFAAMGLIGFRPHGSLLDFGVFLVISAAAMISVGLLVAARISNEEVADGVLNLMTWPMIFLSGTWFSLEGASHWVHFASNLMPLTHVVDGLRSILIDGVSIHQLYPQVTLLGIISVIFVAVGSFIFKWR